MELTRKDMRTHRAAIREALETNDFELIEERLIFFLSKCGVDQGIRALFEDVPTGSGWLTECNALLPGMQAAVQGTSLEKHLESNSLEKTQAFLVELKAKAASYADEPEENADSTGEADLAKWEPRVLDQDRVEEHGGFTCCGLLSKKPTRNYDKLH